MEERCDGDEGLFLPFSKRERLQLAEMPLRKIQKKRRRTPGEEEGMRAGEGSQETREGRGWGGGGGFHQERKDDLGGGGGVGSREPACPGLSVSG